MGKTILCGCSKGGVSKTVSTYNVGAQLAMKGNRVLLIDSDPQASLSIITGLDPEDYLGRNLTSLLNDIDREIDIHDCIVPLDPGLKKDCTGSVSIIPTDIAMVNGDLDFISRPGNDRLLKNILDDIKDEYDFICIDSLPSLGIISINDIAASDYIIGCVEPGYQAYRGVGYYKQVVDKLIKSYKYKTEFIGIIISKITRSNDSKDLTDLLRTEYNVLGEIPLSVEVSKGEFEGLPISTRKPGHIASQGYSDVADYIISRAKGE